jgi:hypothetical protein
VYAILTVFASLTLTLAANTIITIHYVQESDRQLCGVLNISQQPRPKPPVNPDGPLKTEYGKQLLEYNKQVAAFQAEGVREIQRLSKKYDCPEGKS